ncbi:MAG: hypothetical protein ACRD36_08110, partial [Candidatus Acidiferrum sp.]
PRESGDAEQGLYDQLVQLLDSQTEITRPEFVILTAQWFQNLRLDAEELRVWCAPLVGQALAAMNELDTLARENLSPATILLTAAASRLPGLMQQLEDGQRGPAVVARLDPGGDFGDGLLLDDRQSNATIHALAPDAVARAAHQLAVHVEEGSLPHGHHLDLPVPTRAWSVGRRARSAERGA